MLTSISCKTEKKEDEVFYGFLSSSVYESAEEAAEAYFNEQIKGGDYEDCEFKSYTPKKELTRVEISALSLSTIESDDVIFAERGKVSVLYGDEVFSNSVYILQTEEGFYYYMVEPKDDEAVCYDFYNHLVSEEVMNNVTVTTKAMVVCELASYVRQTEVVIVYRYNGDVIQYEAVVRRFFNGGINEIVYRGYIISKNDSIAIYGLNERDEYVDITNENSQLFVNSNKNDTYMVNEMSKIYLDGHYLFKVDDERYVLRMIEEENLAKRFKDVYYTQENGIVRATSYSVKVVNQKLVSAAMNVYSESEDGSQTVYVSIETAFFAYGETKVELPEGIKNQLATYTII